VARALLPAKSNQGHSSEFHPVLATSQAKTGFSLKSNRDYRQIASITCRTHCLRAAQRYFSLQFAFGRRSASARRSAARLKEASAP